jgi:HicB family
MGRGDFLARLGEERREKLAAKAAKLGVSMNQLLCEGVDIMLEGEGMSRSEARKEVLAEISAVVAKLGQGHVLVPAAEGLPASWDGMMDEGST